MGKSDDLQRMREEQHARREREAQAREKESKAKPAPAPAPVVTSVDVDFALPLDTADEAKLVAPEPLKAVAPKAKPEAETVAADTGRCSSCGKVKTLNRGLVVDHQKGLGKACPGSRKRPA